MGNIRMLIAGAAGKMGRSVIREALATPGVAIAGGAETIIVSGGGAHNPTMLDMLAAATGADVRRAAD